MADMRISEDFIIGQASLVNEIEDQRDTFNDALKSAWSDYREELKLLGLTGKEIAAEVAALKSAISDTRMTAEDRAKAEEKADGKDGYLAILSGPRARARIREAKSEPLLTKAAGQAQHGAVIADTDAQNVVTSLPGAEGAEDPETIIEQQAPQPASDLTNSPSLPGQVAPIQPETANEIPSLSADGGANTGGSDEDLSDRSVEPFARPGDEDDAQDDAVAVGGGRHEVANTSAHNAAGEGATIASAASAAGSSNGRTAAFDAANDGSTPSPASKPLYAVPGIVTTEHTPPEPVKWHPYAQCFPTVLGDDLKALESDIHTAFGGVRDPIVKIGNLILDGRARYGIARSLMIDYPVVQYAGTDPLMDVIEWNLASRFDRMTSVQIAATAKSLCKLEPHRADDIMQAFGLETAEAAQ